MTTPPMIDIIKIRAEKELVLPDMELRLQQVADTALMSNVLHDDMCLQFFDYLPDRVHVLLDTIIDGMGKSGFAD